MSRGTAVREFVGKLRSAFYLQLGVHESGEGNDDVEFFGYTVQHAFERAVNDTLLGQSTESKPAPKPRKKRRTKAQMQEPEVPA